MTRLESLCTLHGVQGGTIHQYSKYGDVLGMSNSDFFKLLYAKNLARCLVTNKEEYLYSETELPKVLERMNAAIDRTSFDKDGQAFKATCKQLGIKHTYKAISEYLRKDV